MKPILTSALFCVLLLAAAAPAGEFLNAPYHFVCPFDTNAHSCVGALNPYTATGHTTFVPDGKGGRALRFRGHDPDERGRPRLAWKKSALVVDGMNVPYARGTIAFRLRLSGKRRWNDGRRAWLIAMVPDVGDGSSSFGGKAVGLTLFKDKDNTLALGEYRFHDDRIGTTFHSRKSGYEVAEPDAFPAKIKVGDLKPDAWVPVRVSWDRAAGKVWLGVGDRLASGKVRFLKPGFRCVIFGSPPSIYYASAKGYEGDLDDLVFEGRTPAQHKAAGLELPKPLPEVALPPGGLVPVKLLTTDPIGSKMESIVRSHLAHVLRTQQRGGWAYTSAWPSAMNFMSAKMVVPMTRNSFAGSKDGNSSFAALMLLVGYMTLDEQAYLDAAERTARTLLLTQYPDGHWPYGSQFQPDKGKFVPRYSGDRAPFEDHVQAHPTLLLWLLRDFTGKKEYQVAADKAVEFIRRGQNPNGSWSHHWSLQHKCGQAARGHLRGGELNDDATADQMRIMLLAYRRSGDVKYLASFLRGADWIADAFIDAKAKGWAQQYDEKNNPIQARHFEPAAVSLSEGIDSAPRMLMLAWRMTGGARYRAPLDKWRRWMLDNRVFLNKEKTRWGWHLYYDVKDGKAFRMAKRKRIVPDPRFVREGGYSRLLREIEHLDRPVATITPTPERAVKMLRAVEGLPGAPGGPVPIKFRPMSLVRSFDWEVGTWVGGGRPTGEFVVPFSPRVAFIAWSVFLRRQLLAEIPFTHRLSCVPRGDWWDPFYFILPPQEMNKPLTKGEIAKAREYIRAKRAM